MSGVHHSRKPPCHLGHRGQPAEHQVDSRRPAIGGPLAGGLEQRQGRHRHHAGVSPVELARQPDPDRMAGPIGQHQLLPNDIGRHRRPGEVASVAPPATIIRIGDPTAARRTAHGIVVPDLSGTDPQDRWSRGGCKRNHGIVRIGHDQRSDGASPRCAQAAERRAPLVDQHSDLGNPVKLIAREVQQDDDLWRRIGHEPTEVSLVHLEHGHWGVWRPGQCSHMAGRHVGSRVVADYGCGVVGADQCRGQQSRRSGLAVGARHQCDTTADGKCREQTWVDRQTSPPSGHSAAPPPEQTRRAVHGGDGEHRHQCPGAPATPLGLRCGSDAHADGRVAASSSSVGMCW